MSSNPAVLSFPERVKKAAKAAKVDEDKLLLALEAIGIEPDDDDALEVVRLCGDLGEVFEKAGAMRYIRLKTSGPFHSPLLEEARRGLQEALADYAFADPVKPVYSNVTGRRIGSGAEAKELCARQIVSTIRWVAEEQSLLDDGCDRLLETGPGTVLTGLWKSFYKKFKCEPAGKLEQIEALSMP